MTLIDFAIVAGLAVVVFLCEVGKREHDRIIEESQAGGARRGEGDTPAVPPPSPADLDRCVLRYLDRDGVRLPVGVVEAPSGGVDA